MNCVSMNALKCEKTITKLTLQTHRATHTAKLMQHLENLLPENILNKTLVRITIDNDHQKRNTEKINTFDNSMLRNKLTR